MRCKMTINNNKLKTKISEHKKTIKYLFKTKIIPESKLNNTMKSLKLQFKELVLVTNNFQCTKCGSKKELQFHHTIMRDGKKFLELPIYLAVRNYYEHVKLLCKKCHREHHEMNEERGGHTNAGCIDVEFINGVKEKYNE